MNVRPKRGSCNATVPAGKRKRFKHGACPPWTKPGHNGVHPEVRK